MPPTLSWSFGPFRLDAATASLWLGEQLIHLPPKPLAVLANLVAHAGQVVTKDALLQAAWPEVVVTEGVLKTCLGEIRRALGETAKAPQYIVTVHRRGYRFIAPVTVANQVIAGKALPGFPPTEEHSLRPASALRPAEPVVGREAELTQLHQWWTQALRGARQVVFVTGEAGIGKTTLVEAFVAPLADEGEVWIGHGQCIEHYGAGEAYFPLLEALGQLGRGAGGAHLVALLHQYAPSWLVHLPALVPEADYEAVRRRAGEATRDRMLRELAEVVEALTALRPLVLVLEDLHWSDRSTVGWLAYLARRREAARVLVVGTYRPAEAIVRTNPVRAVTQELLLHRQCAELTLGYLPPAGVATYLAQRLGEGVLPVPLAHQLHQRTAGNPLFLVTVVDELVRQGLLRQGSAGWELGGEIATAVGGLPDSLRHLLERQVEQLPASDLELLEAASVAGAEFCAAAVAAGVEREVEEVEAHYDALARWGQVVSRRGSDVWPDGTVSARYGFIHDLYRETLYGRVSVSRRGRWHRAMGQRLEQGYGAQARELAAELAEHFTRGKDSARAVPYLQYAGEQAVQRSAHQEALRHLTQGLELLATLPDTPARARQELDLQVALGPVLIATRSQAAPEVEQTYARARALCAQLGDTPQLFPTLQGLCEFYRNRGALPTARELGEQLHRSAQRQAEPTLRLEAHVALGTTLFHLGEYTPAWTHLEQGLALTEPPAQRALAWRQGVAPGVRCLALAANTLWCLGYPVQAVRRSQESLALAQALAHPYSVAMAQHFAAFLQHRRRDAAAARAQAEALLSLATAQGFPLYVGYGTCYRGWALAVQGESTAGLAQMRQGLAALLATGLELSRPLWLVLLAEVAGQVGQEEEGRRLLVEALTAFETSGRGDMRAEAYRLQGALLLRQAVPEVAEAEACFQQALALARGQQAKSWELRAAMSLSRLWQRQGKGAEARELLAPIYGWFTEGFDAADLQEAKALLEQLG